MVVSTTLPAMDGYGKIKVTLVENSRTKANEERYHGRHNGDGAVV